MLIITPREVRADINRAIHFAREALFQLERLAETEATAEDSFFLLFVDDYADLAITAAGRIIGHAEKAKALRAKLVPARELAA